MSGGPTDRINLLSALFILWKAVQELAEKALPGRAVSSEEVTAADTMPV